jgi:hypothetical protein
MTEPEPYESPPVAARYRANEERPGSGAPASEFWSRPPAKPQPSASAATVGEHDAEPEVVAELGEDPAVEATPTPATAPLPTGGPRFLPPPPVPSPGGRWHRRPDRNPTPGGPLGTFQPGWSLPEPSRARRLRPLLIPLLVLAVLGAAAYVAYPHVRTLIRARSVPADLRSYVNGHGIVYTPVGQGYSVRLPGVPVHRDQQVTSSDGKRSMLVRRSIVAGAGYQIVIRVDAAGVKLPPGLAAALQDPFLAGSDAPAIVHKTVIAGETAYEGQVHARHVLPFEVAVLMHGGRLYVIRIEARSVATVFDAVARSFRFTS